MALEKMVSGRLRIVHSYLLHCCKKRQEISESMAHFSKSKVPRPGTAQTCVHDCGNAHINEASSGRGSPIATFARRLPRNAGRTLIWIYRHSLSALVGSSCRHIPTCSAYADEAVERFGLWAGGWMTLARLLRCHPYGTSGIDNVPLAAPPGARWYLPWRFGRWRGANSP